MRRTTLAASVLAAALALGACGGGDDGGNFFGGNFFGGDVAAPEDAGEFGDLGDLVDLGNAGAVPGDSGGETDEEFQARLDASLDQFIADGLGLDEAPSEGGVGVENADSAQPVLDGGLLVPDALEDALSAIEDEHGGPLAPLFVRITATQVIVAIDEDQHGYLYEDGEVTATDVGDLGTFGPAALATGDLDVDLDTLVLYASDEADFDPGRAVEVSVGRSRLDSDLAFARIIVSDTTEGYVDVSLDGEVLTDNAG